VPFAFADDRLPGLATTPSAAAAETAVRHDPGAVRTRWAGAAPTRTREVRDRARVLLSVDHDPERGYLVAAPGIGSALTAPDGREVVCAPAGPDWPALLVGQILPLVATVRGLEVFHAAGVAVAERGFLLAGAQGAGKTSLAAHLVLGGAQLLSDDVVAIDDGLGAHPGSSLLRVRAGELGALDGGGLVELGPAGTSGDRRALLAPAPAGAVPLAGIYRLERAATDGPVIEPMAQPSPIDLVALTFNISVRTRARLTHQLDLCARLTEAIPVFRVRVTPARDAAAVAAALRAHMERRMATAGA
jgi:hypothetical protein